MYTYDIEDITLKVIDVLGDGIAAKLDVIEALKTTNPLTLENIERIYFGDKIPGSVPTQNMPALLIKGREFTPVASSTNNRYRDNPIIIEVECYIVADMNMTKTIDGREYMFDEVLDIKIMRYARAIVELLAENMQLGGMVENMEFKNVLLSNVMPYQNMMAKACRVEVSYTGISTTLGS
jgi:hypothetical protein